MGDATKYCTTCETNTMCHQQRGCVKAEMSASGDYVPTSLEALGAAYATLMAMDADKQVCLMVRAAIKREESLQSNKHI